MKVTNMKNAILGSMIGGVIGIAALASGYYAGTMQQAIPTAATQPPASASTPRQTVEAIVRNYLLENPELIVEVQDSLERKQAEAAQLRVKEIIASNKDELYNSSHDAIFGNPNGDVTVVEFFDYNCGYCKRALPDMQAILKNDPNVRFVMKEFPILGPDSMRAHIVAQAFKALMPEKYAQYHEILLSAAERATEESAIADAVKLGADETQLREKMQSPEIRGAFQNTYQLASQLNITGTPSYIVGNELVPGAIGAEGLIERIAAARAAAKN